MFYRKIYLIAVILLGLSACKKNNSTLEQAEPSKTTIQKKSATCSLPTSSTTVRGLIHSPEKAVEATYSLNTTTSTLTISLSEVTKISSDKSTLRTYGVSINSSGEVTIPVGSNDYWVVPFDDNIGPYRLTGGETVKKTCRCPSGGSGCTMTVTDDCKATCNQGTCSSPNDCELIEDNPTPPARPTLIGSAIIVEAQTIIYNGTTYN